MSVSMSSKRRCGRKPRFGLGDIALAMELKDAGLSYAQIAAKWDSGNGMSTATAYYLCNPRSEKKWRHLTAAEKQRVIELRRSGLSYPKVSEQFEREFGRRITSVAVYFVCNPRRSKRH